MVFWDVDSKGATASRPRGHLAHRYWQDTVLPTPRNVGSGCAHCELQVKSKLWRSRRHTCTHARIGASNP